MDKQWRNVAKDKHVFGQSKQPKAEAEVDHDYYAFLNVAQDCSEEDIKAAYKRLALIWHPDRHNDEVSRAHATEKFSRLTHIYEVLVHPAKRQLYDLYGEKGLTSGLEVGAHLQTPEKMREEYARLSAKKAQREEERKLGLTGILQTTISVEKQLMRYLQPDVVHVDLDNKAGGGKKKRRKQILQSMMLSERFKTSISRKDSAELQGYLKAQEGEASCAISLSLERRFSPRSSFKAIMEMGLGVIPRPLSLVALRNLSSQSVGKMCLRFSEAYNELRCSVSRNLSPKTIGKIQYIIGGPQTGVKLRGTHSGQNSLIGMSFWAGFGQYQVGLTGQKRLSKATTLSVNSMLGDQGLDLVLGCQRKISERSSFLCSCVLSPVRGVIVKLGLSRMGQDLAVPIIISKELTLQAATAGTVIPAVLGVLLKTFWLRPRKIARRKRKLEEERRANAENISKARKEAMTDIELMRFAVARKRQMEEQRNGLIIIKAVFGKIPKPPTRRTTSTEEEWPAADETGDATTIDVTTPLQYLLEDSKLQLFNSAKSGLPGFCDPVPGEEKQLYVLYRFKRRLHEVLCSDRQPLVVPLERDLLPPGSQRLVRGVTVQHEDAPRKA